jgi:hypothetical protein
MVYKLRTTENKQEKSLLCLPSVSRWQCAGHEAIHKQYELSVICTQVAEDIIAFEQWQI